MLLKQIQISVCKAFHTTIETAEKKTMWVEPVPYIQMHYYIHIHLFTLARFFFRSIVRLCHFTALQYWVLQVMENLT